MVALVDINNPKERSRMSLPTSGQQRRTAVALRSKDNSEKPPIPLESQNMIRDYYNTVLSTYITSFNIRPQMLARDLAYYREEDFTRQQALAKGYNAAGDASKIQNVTIPIVMPQVESMLAYQTGVFLTGYPMFGVVAPPDQMDAIGQMETIIGENSIRGCWPQELMKTLRNGFKYDLGACEVDWKKLKQATIGTPEVDKLANGKVDETYYEGNFIKDLDPYNIILDTRVSPDRNHIEGEIAGYIELLSAIAMKQRLDAMDPTCTMNFKRAYESPSTGVQVNSNSAGYFLPSVNPGALLAAAQQQPFSWDSFVSGMRQNPGREGIKYQTAYEYATIYLRIIPVILGIPTRNNYSVQIWKFIIVNRSVIVFAERQLNAHGYLPILVCKPSNDGMSWQSKSFAQNAEPYQQVASALTNSAMESQRRKVFDRIFYDPNRVNKKDIDNVSSVARIPVKNSMYNKDISSAIYVAPYRDDGVAEILSFAQNVTSMAEIGNGQNRVQQGQFQKGNKTRREFDTVMSNANGRQQMVAIGLEYSFFSPMKEIIKSNILQFQPPVSLMNRMKGANVAIDPTVLRKSLVSFKLSDGLLPSEKIVNPEMFTLLLQSAQAIPELRAKYDFMGAFQYQMALQGADWMKAFERSDEEAQKYMQMMMGPAAIASGSQKPPEPGTPDAGAAGAT